jgi:hypothetical protein
VIAIKAKSESNDLVGELRELLPELGIAEIKNRLRSGAVLVERETLENDWREAQAVLRGVVAALKKHRADFTIHEWVTDSGIFDGPDARNEIDETVMENIFRGDVEEMAHQRRLMDEEIAEKGYVEVEPDE